MKLQPMFALSLVVVGVAGAVFLVTLIAAVFDKRRRQRWFMTSGWAAIVLMLVWFGMVKIAEYRGDLAPPVATGNQQPERR